MFPPSFARLLLNVQLNLAQGGQGGQDMQNKEYTLGFSSSLKRFHLILRRVGRGASERQGSHCHNRQTIGSLDCSAVPRQTFTIKLMSGPRVQDFGNSQNTFLRLEAIKL